MYAWRKMTPSERRATLTTRQQNSHPWHSIPTIDSGPATYLLTATCYEHRPHIARTRSRLTDFSQSLTKTLTITPPIEKLIAWAVLPNHYHALCQLTDLTACKKLLAQLHGRTSRQWNQADATPQRKIWFRTAETVMKSDAHYWATINYIHHNPVKHRCAESQNDWQWSSFHQWQEALDREALVDLWRTYPINDYGKSWDTQDLSTHLPPQARVKASASYRNPRLE